MNPGDLCTFVVRGYKKRENVDMVLGEKPCIRCGSRRLVWSYGPSEGHGARSEDDGLCPNCRRDKHAEMEIADGETEFCGEDEVRCPWCGKRVHHEIGLDDGICFHGGIETCPHCGRRYNVTAIQHWTYDTVRVDQ